MKPTQPTSVNTAAAAAVIAVFLVVATLFGTPVSTPGLPGATSQVLAEEG